MYMHQRKTRDWSSDGFCFTYHFASV